MELGPIQKAWVQSLREHPERQTTKALGIKQGDSYKACCLGELHIIGCEMLGKPSPFDGDVIKDKIEDIDHNYGYGEKTESEATLIFSYEDYGLKSGSGYLKMPNGDSYYLSPEGKYSSVAGMNDYLVPWPEIADFIESNPEIVFTKSV